MITGATLKGFIYFLRDIFRHIGFIHVEIRYDFSHFLAVSRLDRYRNITLTLEIIGEVLVWQDASF